MRLKLSRFSVHLYNVALCLFVFSSLCLYNPEKVSAYVGLSFVVMLLVVGAHLSENEFHIRMTKALKWDFVVYLMFTIYGCLFLASPNWPYNWDFMIFTAVLNIVVYWLFEYYFYSHSYNALKQTLTVSLIATIIYAVLLEKDNLGELGVRFGDSLSGNVNTVGVSLGFLSLIYIFLIVNTKPERKIEKGIDILIMLSVFVFMLLTGSKKSIVFLVIDLILLVSHTKNKALSIFYFIGLGVLFLFLVLSNEYLYSVIGSRVEDMIYSLFGIGSGKPSHSTQDRAGMIADGFRIFLQNPIFGGGEKFYSVASTKYGYYGYSHCNYTEMLCNFGIFGTFIYYTPIFRNLYILISRRNSINLAGLGISLLIAKLITDWMMVSYSDLSVSYMPVMISFLIIDLYNNNRMSLKESDVING